MFTLRNQCVTLKPATAGLALSLGYLLSQETTKEEAEAVGFSLDFLVFQLVVGQPAGSEPGPTAPGQQGVLVQ